MSYQVLARKYRPQNFSDVIGQEHVTRTLKNAIEQGRTAHGYIFSGHRGIGKTTVARILAMALNCRSSDKPVTEPCGICESCTEIRAGNSVDVIEIDAATNRGIDEIRELREAARYRPARDRFKIYILDEAHQITDAAFNALLKTLEEPPSHVVFMLATTQPEDIPQTIRSRCQHFSFRAVRFEAILGQLKDLGSRENVEADEDALALLAEAGDGSIRDALSILDQAIASCDGRLTADAVRQLVGAAPSTVLEEVMQAVARSSSEEVLRLVDRLISEGHSPTHFARQMVRFLRNSVVAKIAGGDSSLLQISGDERTRVARVAELFSEEDLRAVERGGHGWSRCSQGGGEADGCSRAEEIRIGYAGAGQSSFAIRRGFGTQKWLQTTTPGRRQSSGKRPCFRDWQHDGERRDGIGGSGGCRRGCPGSCRTRKSASKAPGAGRSARGLARARHEGVDRRRPPNAGFDVGRRRMAGRRQRVGDQGGIVVDRD
jgi:DNA polymerase III subunit gamma/tau